MSIFESQEPKSSQNVNCGNVNGSYNNIWNNCDIRVTDERRHILEWLSPIAPQLRHRDVRSSQVEGVGDWLLRTEEFINWSTGEDGVAIPVLFCDGDPGVGKTHIRYAPTFSRANGGDQTVVSLCSTLVIETLCNRNIGKQVAVACLYCDFNAHQEQSIAHMLGAILKQVVSGWEHIPPDIGAAFQKSKKNLGGRELDSAEILKLLISTLRTLDRSYICIDALDEFSQDHRRELFKSLEQITRESPSTRLFVTGRPHIREEVERYFTKRAEIRIIPSEEDIKKYLTMRLSNDPQPTAMNQDLRENILTTIPEKIAGIFLLVSLSMNEILARSTIHGRRETLSKMTSGVGMVGAYGATLERIEGQGGDKAKLGMEVLMWVSQSERPLSAEELCHALGIEEDTTELDLENIPATEILISCCLGLVALDEEGSRVRLIHLTLHEYLGGRPDLFGNAHSKMAEVCLTYLNFQSIKDLPPDIETPPKTAPFLDYASCYWGVHARNELTESTKSLALKLLDQFSHHVAARMLLLNQGSWHYELPSGSGYSGTTGLHVIACFGIAEIAKAMIKSGGWEVNRRDCRHYTPLIWAAINNNPEVCEALLESGGADPNITNRKGSTPLFAASHAGHESIVKVLLARDEVNPDSPDDAGRTPLLRAAWGGHEGIVKLLLERKGVNLYSSDWLGRTPLFHAASRGHEGIVKLLLERRDVNPVSPNNWADEPLQAAASRGYEGIVKLLLGCTEVNPESPNRRGQTPLSRAASRGHEGIVKLLLERKGVNLYSSDWLGQTPLFYAASRGHEGIVKMLLEPNEVNPDSPNKNGETPFWGAASSGHEGIVKLLLERKEVHPESPNQWGETPLWKAATGGHEGIVKLLLEHKEVNPETSNQWGRTPLSVAASGGHESIVKLLLCHKKVNPDSSGTDGETPLSLAAVRGHEGTVKLLLERKEVNPKSPNKRGETPLWKSASGGHDGTVKLLLKRKEVNPDSSDMDGRTPLWEAVRNGKEGAVRLLLERKDVNPNPSCMYVEPQLPVDWNSDGHTEEDTDDDGDRNSNEDRVRPPRERKKANPDPSNNKFETPLSLATKNGHMSIVKLLRERLSADSNPSEACDQENRCPTTSLLDSTPTPAIIPGSAHRDDLKQQSNPREVVSGHLLNTSENQHNTPMDAPDLNRNYHRLFCALLLLLLSLIPPLDLKLCLIFGLFVFFLVYI